MVFVANLVKYSITNTRSPNLNPFSPLKIAMISSIHMDRKEGTRNIGHGRMPRTINKTETLRNLINKLPIMDSLTLRRPTFINHLGWYAFSYDPLIILGKQEHYALTICLLKLHSDMYYLTFTITEQHPLSPWSNNLDYLRFHKPGLVVSFASFNMANKSLLYWSHVFISPFDFAI